MKVKWVKATPKEEGWYWVKYKNKRSKYTVCPAQVIIFKSEGDGLNGNMVLTAKNDSFMEGPAHGGWGLRYNGVLDPSIRFGPKIEEPDA